jgi:hypothetical protein
MPAAVFWYPRRMYVRWVSRNRDRKGGGVLIAQLVESDGKSGKRILAHLGTCREPVDTLRHRLRFYERCEQTLDRLALAPEDRAKVDAQLAARIPPLSDEDRAQRQHERAILMRSFARPEARVAPDTAIVRVPFGGLGKTMMKTRLWLEDQKIELFEVTTSLDADGYACRFQFRKINDADRFRAQFRQPEASG